MKGKSDPMDAYAAAAVASGRAGGVPKTRDGIVEAVRSLRVVRRSAVKSRTQAINQTRQLVRTSPEQVRSVLRDLSVKELTARCARLRPGPDLTDPVQAVKFALRRLGKRISVLDEGLQELDVQLETLTPEAARELLEL